MLNFIQQSVNALISPFDIHTVQPVPLTQITNEMTDVNIVEIITKTRLYNLDPLKPHFCIVKLGFTGVYIIFLFLFKT